MAIYIAQVHGEPTVMRITAWRSAANALIERGRAAAATKDIRVRQQQRLVMRPLSSPDASPARAGGQSLRNREDTG